MLSSPHKLKVGLIDTLSLCLNLLKEVLEIGLVNMSVT